MYSRPKIKKLERAQIDVYLEDYSKLLSDKESHHLANIKLDRRAFDVAISRMEETFDQQCSELLVHPLIQKFLNDNPVPKALEAVLTDKVRVYCLFLNAVKQWATAEQLAADRIIFSGNVREIIKQMAKGKNCPISGEEFNEVGIELHHPSRDGRPPIALSPRGHAEIEEIFDPAKAHPALRFLFRERKKDGKPLFSWKKIWVGCRLLFGETEDELSPEYKKKAKAQATKWLRKLTEQNLQIAPNQLALELEASGLYEPDSGE